MSYDPRAVNSDVLARAIEFERTRPAPPREVRLVDGKLTWSPPQNESGITHYNIYAENENALVEQVPAGQYVLRSNLAASRVLVSSWNAALKLESRLVLLNQNVSGGEADLNSITLTIASVTAAYTASTTGNGAIKVIVTVTGTATGTGFDRVAAYIRTPLESDPTPLDPEPDGTLTPVGEFTGLTSNWTIKMEFDPPIRQEGWRFYFTQGTKSGTAPLSITSVTYLLLVDPIPSGPSGSEWAPSVTGFTATVEYAEAETGGQVWRVFGTFTAPTDEKYRGLEVVGRDPSGKDIRLSFVPRGTNGYTSDYYAVPLAPQNWTIYGRSFGPNARTNNITGATPSVPVTVQRQSGGGLRLNQVNATTLDLTEFQISSGALRMNQINATKIWTGIMSVGAGGNKPGQIAIFNGAGAPIGWIGEQGVTYGAWFSQLWVGGNGPSTAPLFVDGVGNVRLDNTGLTQEASFKLVKGGTDTRLQNTDPNAFGAVYGLDVRATSGSPILRAAVSPYGIDCYSGASLVSYMDQAGYHMVTTGGLLREWRRSDGVLNASGLEIGGSTTITSGRQALLVDLTVGGGIGSFNSAGQIFCTKVNVNGVDRITTFGDVYGQEVHSGSAFFVNNNQVVGPRAGAIPNVSGSIPGSGANTADSASGTLFTILVSLLNSYNTLLATLRAGTGHGLFSA